MVVTLEEEIANKIADQMTEDIDREMLWGILEQAGWTRTGYYAETFIGQSVIDEIQEWVKNNARGNYKCYLTDFIFEDSKDATWFILRWS